MVDWIKKNKDWLTAVLGLGVFILLLALFGLFFQGRTKQTPGEQVEKEKIEKIDLISENSSGDSSSPALQTTSFFLKPTPTELMENFREMEPYELKTEAKKLPGLRVMWPTYFFSILKEDPGIVTLLLDTTEDGFGVTIVCDINSSKYPQILKLKRGDKLWVAGEISGMDSEGVGQIFITPEHIKFKEDEEGIITPNDKDQ